ncbi:MAG TPA: chemotaxis protein [Cyanobacteria bacterium UBA8803]|nr:chemotaxis protein [Cyanobacteria bacterium UBA9273]HBL58484.1 chemotaxis protein [Cyanobacteria bacterium UBA8803]
MTQLSSNSQNSTKNRTSYPVTMPLDDPTHGSNYSSPHRLLAVPDQTAIKLPKPEEMPYGNKQNFPSSSPRQKSHGWLGKSLRTKVVALALSLGTLPVLLIGTIAYFTASQGMYQQIEKNQEINATDLEDKLSAFINERFADIQAVAQLPAFRNAEVRKVMTPEERQRVLDSYVKLYKAYDSIAVFDLQGNVIAQSESGGEILENHFDQDYFQEVLKTDRPYIREPRLSEFTKIMSLYVAAPIKDRITGKTIAIVRGRAPMSIVNEVLGSEEEREQEFHLIDSTGQVIASGDPNDITQKVDQKFPKLYSSIKGKADQLLTLVEARPGREDIITYSPTDALAKEHNFHWALILLRPTRVAFAPQRNLLWTIGIGTGATAVLVGIMATIVANRATRPILDVANAVNKIGHGKLDTRLVVEGDDEIADLEVNINDMAEQLGNLVHEQELATAEARLLAEITGSRTLETGDFPELFQKAAEGTRPIFQADRVIVCIFQPDGRGEIVAESVVAGWPRALDDRTKQLSIPESLMTVYRDGDVIARKNVFEAGLAPDQMKIVERLAVKASLEVPIFQQGKLFGLLMVHYCGNPHEWQPSEIAFAKQLAGQLGLCIDRVTLLEETETLAQEQRQLKEGLQKRALELLQEVDPISKGNLTIRARVTADEIGTIADSYNATVSNLRKIVLQVQEAASQVAQTTNSSEKSVEELSAEALRQAEEIALALERAQEMVQSVQLVAESAEKAEAAVQQAAQTVQEGDMAMNRTVQGIIAIRDTVAETAKKVKHLGESSQKISTVVNLIGTFAAQTNLLALNASIEAARAGEEGRGFAVVADEVRALARQSAEATSEIEKLVAAIQGETNEVVAAMESGTEQVVIGTKLVDETRQSLNKIAAASIQINTLVEAIAQATVVQSQASATVTKTMTDVAAIAQKTSTGATQVSASFKQLLSVAQALQEDVGQFQVS